MEDWKKLLKRMKLNSIKEKAPGFFIVSGGYDMIVKPYRDNTANDLTKAVIDFINFSGGDANRINCQGQVRKINGRMVWTHGSTRKGVADIHAIFKGHHISIENKIGNDKQSNDQVKEMGRVRRAGGLYFVAKNMDSFLDWWQGQFSKETILENNKYLQK